MILSITENAIKVILPVLENVNRVHLLKCGNSALNTNTVQVSSVSPILISVVRPPIHNC